MLPDAQPDIAQYPGATELSRERCASIYNRILPAITATVVLSLSLSALLWLLRPSNLIFFWQGMMLLLAAAFCWIAEAYRRSPTARERPDLWIRRAAFGAAMVGAGWGVAAAVFFPDAEREQAVMILLASLVTAAGLPFFSTVWWVYALYAAGTMLPFCVALFAHGTDFFRLLSVAVPLLYAANVAAAVQLGRTFSTAYGLRGAHDRLSGENAEAQVQLTEQLNDLVEAHRKMQAYGRKLSLFSERAPIAVFEVDAQATILEMNPAAENLFAYGAPEMVGRNAITMLLGAQDLDQTKKWWTEMVSAGKPSTVVAERCMRRDGFELTCEWTLTPLVNEEGCVTSVMVQGRDITQQRATERMKNEFTSTLSHELRTPVTSILGSLQLVSSGVLGDLDKDQKELVEVAERNSQRLLDLINEVLDIEKMEAGHLTLMPEPVALDGLLRESLRLNQGFADRFMAKLVITGAIPEVIVRGDVKRLMQVMTNLLSNAAKFSPPNGMVEVSVQLKEANVRVAIGDRGPGIPEKLRSRMFGRFVQGESSDSRTKGGTGLGLAISKRLVELMHGHVGFEDRDGGGTTFYFELPVMKADNAAKDIAMRVLLTEHDAVAAEYLGMALQKGGYRIDVAQDASATHALLGRWKYAAWLLSCKLPDADDPLALIAALRDRLEDTKIIMLASQGSEQTSTSELQRHGIADWLMKSDSRARILEIVDKWTGRVSPLPET